jgi:hypothetical protein
MHAMRGCVDSKSRMLDANRRLVTSQLAQLLCGNEDTYIYVTTAEYYNR